MCVCDGIYLLFFLFVEGVGDFSSMYTLFPSLMGLMANAAVMMDDESLVFFSLYFFLDHHHHHLFLLLLLLLLLLFEKMITIFYTCIFLLPMFAARRV